MKKFIIGGVLLAVALSFTGVALADTNIPLLINNGTQPSIYTTVLTNNPGNNGAVADIQQLRLRINQLWIIINNLYALIKARQEAQGGGDDGTSTNPPVVTTAKAKISLNGLKAHYPLATNISFSVSALAKENSSSNILTFPSGCQVSYKIYQDDGSVAIYDSAANTVCTQAASSITLPYNWSLTHDVVAHPLSPGRYHLAVQVIGVGTLDWYFRIQSPLAPTVTLLSPSVNQIWATSSQNTITWSSTNALSSDQVEIRLTPIGNTLTLVGSTLVGSSLNDGTETIKVPGTMASGSYRLVLSLTSGGQTVNSAQVVNIVVPSPDTATYAPFINSLSTYSAATGTSLVINGLNFTAYNNQVSFAGTNVASSSATNGQITIKVPDLSAGSYAIKVTNDNGISNAVNFTVLAAPITTPVATVINVLTPAADSVEEWVAGTSKTILWSSTPTKDNGGASAVNIRLVDPVTNLIQDVAYNVPNTGSYTWVIGKLANGTSITGKYRIRICPIGLGDCDRGNKNIKIVPATSNGKVSDASKLQMAATAATLQGLIEQLNGLLRLR